MKAPAPKAQLPYVAHARFTRVEYVARENADVYALLEDADRILSCASVALKSLALRLSDGQDDEAYCIQYLLEMAKMMVATAEERAFEAEERGRNESKL